MKRSDKKVTNYPLRTSNYLILDVIIDFVIILFSLIVPLIILIPFLLQIEDVIWACCCSSIVYSIAFFVFIWIYIEGGGGLLLILIRSIRSITIQGKKIIIKRFWRTLVFPISDTVVNYRTSSYSMIIESGVKKYYFSYIQKKCIDFLIRNGIEVTIDKKDYGKEFLMKIKSFFKKK